MTSRGYFGKMNSTLGSVVPLAMFSIVNSMLDMPTILTFCERNSMTTGGATSDVNFSTPNFDVFVFTKVFTTCRETEK